MRDRLALGHATVPIYRSKYKRHVRSRRTRAVASPREELAVPQKLHTDTLVAVIQ